MQEDNEEKSLRLFQASMAQFSFSSPSTSSGVNSSPQKSPRKPVLRGTRANEDQHNIGLDRAQTDDETGPQRSPKKRKRGFAGPEAYAHLRYLQDYLREDLDGALSVPPPSSLVTSFCSHVLRNQVKSLTPDFEGIVSNVLPTLVQDKGRLRSDTILVDPRITFGRAYTNQAS